MGDWIPKDPATLAEIGAAVGGAGIVGKFWDSLFSWWKTGHEHEKNLQTIVDERLKLLLDADDKRLSQMSAAIDGQSAKIDRLEGTVQTLVSHISALEAILRDRQIAVPPRPPIDLRGIAE